MPIPIRWPAVRGVIAAVLLLASAGVTRAQTYSWDPNFSNGTGLGGDGTWDQGSTANWYNGTTDVVWPGAQVAVFGGTAGTVTVSGTVTATGLTFSTTGYTITGGTALDLTGGGNATVTVGSGLTTTINSTLTSSATPTGLTVAGGGTLVLGGTNTFIGPTAATAVTVSGGSTLQIAADAALGDPANGVTLIGSTLASTATFSSARAIALGTGGGTLSAAPGTALTLSGVIGGSTTLTANGAGTLVLSGANTYTGATVVTAGTVVNIQNATALGTVAAGTTVASGAALQIQGGITVGAEALSVGGTGISNDGAVRNISGTNTYGGLLTLTAPTRINSDAGTLTLSNAGTITGAGFGLTVGGAGNTTITSIIGTTTGSVTKDGAGTLTLGGANTYSGGLMITGGVVSVGAESNLGTGGITLNTTGATAATFTYTGAAYTPTAKSNIVVGSGGGTYNLTANVKVTASLAGLFSGSGTLTRAGTVGNLANNLSITAANTTFTGGWVFTGGVTEVSGTNSLGNNSVTNTITLSGGELANNNNTIAQAITINSGTLGGDNGTSIYSGPITANGNFNIRLGDFYQNVFRNLTISGNITGSATFGYYNGSGTTVATGGIGQTLFLNGTNNNYTPNSGTTGLSIPAGVIVSFGSPASIPGSGVSVNGASGFTLGGIGVGYVPASQSALPTLNVNNTSTFGGVFEINVANFNTPLDLGTLYGTSTSPTGGVNGIWYLGSGSSGTYTAATLNSSNGVYRLGGGYGSLTITNGVLVDNGGPASVIVGGATANLVGSNGTGTVTLNGANTYTGPTTINLGHSLIITNGSALGSAAAGTTIAAGGNLSLSGGITVAEPLTISGTSATATISNYANAIVNNAGTNTLTGNITIASLSAGNARVNVPSGALNLTGNITYGGATSANGFVFAGAGNISSSGAISGAMAVFTTNTGTVTVTGANTYTGATSLQAGTYSVSSFNSVNGGTPPMASSSLGAPTTVANGTIPFGSGTTGATLTYTGAGETTDRVVSLAGTSGGATITQSGTGLLKFTSDLTDTGIGAKTLTLSGSTAGAGEIAGAITNSTGSTTKTLNATFASGATTVKLNDTSLNYAAGASISGTGIAANTTVSAVTNASSVDTLTISPGASGASGPVTTTNYTLSGGATSVVKTGSGLWTLSGLNTYTGTTAITGGTLVINSLNAVGGGASSLGNPTTVANGTIAIGTTTTAGTLSYVGTGSTSDRVVNLAGTTGGATLDMSGTGTFQIGAVTATGAGVKTLTLSGSTAGVGVVSGVIANNSATNTTAVTKSGSGTWVLGGANTYTGATTINGGLLQVNGSTTATSAVAVNNGGALGGIGTVNGVVTVGAQAGSGIDLRDGTVGTLTLGGNLTFNGTAAAQNLVRFDLGSATADLIAATGAVTTPAAANSVFVGFNQLAGTPIPDGTYTLISSNATSVPTGFALATTQANGRTYALSTATTGSILSVTVGTATASAATAAVWGGTTSTNWTDAGNWYTDATSGTPAGAAPGLGSNVTFYTTTPAAANLSTTLGADFEINSLTFPGTATTPVTIAGSTNALTIDAGTANGNAAGNGISQLAAATHTISARVGIGAAQTWTVAAGGGLTVSGLVFDTGPGYTLTKAGAGTLTLSNNANTFSGDINVTAGVLAFVGNAGGNGDPQALGAGPKTITVTNNAVLSVITTTSNPTSTNTKKFVVGTGGATFDVGTTGILFQLDDAGQFSGTGDLTVTSSAGPTSTGTVYLNNQAFNFTGNVFVNSGTLRLGTNSVLGTAPGRTITVAAGAALDVNNNSTNIPLTVLLNGTGISNGGALTANSASGTLASPVTLQSDSSVGAASGLTLTLPGTVGGAFNLTKVGAGTAVLSGTNTYGSGTGAATTVTAGTLQAAKTVSLPNYATAGQVVVASGATLALNVGGTGEFAAADVTTILGNGTFASGSGIGFDTTNAGGSFAAPAVVPTPTVAALNLTKLGTGTLTLPGTNAFGTGGTTIVNGTVAVTSGVNNSLGTGGLVFGTSAGTTVGALDLGTTSQQVSTVRVQTNSATANTITVGAGQTLLATGAVTIGVDNAGSPTTKLTVTGATGTFSIGTATTPTNANVQLGNNATTNVSNGTTTDLSGIGTFFANLGTGTFRVGDATNSGGTATLGSTLILSPNTTIAATTITSDSADGSVTQAIKLGSGANVLNANTIEIGGSTSGRSSGTLNFNTTTGSVTVRNLAGTSRAALNVGYGATGTSFAITSTVDLTGHSADLLLTSLNVAGRTGSTGGLTTASVLFDTGTLDATAINVATRGGTAATSTGAVTGTLTVGGGTVTVGATGIAVAVNTSTVSAGTNNALGTVNINGGTVTVGGPITLGSATTAAEVATATLNINGGSLTTAGNIVKGTTTGAVTANLALTAGTLNMAGRDIGTAAAPLNAVTFTGGTLNNLGNIYQPLAQTGAGTTLNVTANSTTVNGANAYTLTGGTLNIADAKTLTAGSAAVGGTTPTLGIGFASTPSATSSGTLVSAGAIDLTGVSAANKLNVPLTAGAGLVDQQAYTLTVINSTGGQIAYNGGTFDPNAFNVTASNFATTSGFTVTGDGNVVQISFTAAVPEPATVGLLAATGLGLGGLLRRRVRPGRGA
jgi:autotransporter-associated beta strand protein